MVDTVITPFNPSPSANFQFQAELDGDTYNIVCTWSAYGQRYYVNIYDLAGTEVLSRPLVGSPDGANISLTAGYFDTTVIYRDSRAVFEIPGEIPIPVTVRPPAPPNPPPPPPPPPPVDPYFDDVVLLLHGEGSQGSTLIQDSSRYSNILTTHGTVTIDDTKGEFTGGSIDMPSGNWLTSQSTLFAWNGVDYTMEGWFYLPTLSSSDGQSLFCARYEHTFDNGQMTIFVHADGTVEFYSADALGDNPVGFTTSAGAFPAAQWVFLSITQNITSTGPYMGTHYLHINGNLAASYTGRLSAAMASGTNIGNYGLDAADQSFNGWMQEYRLTIGVARYTSANYPVPTGRFPNSGP
jgi:hypothetical protein